MRFIKTTDGVYLNTAQIITLYAKSASGQHYVAAGFADYQRHMILCKGFPDAEAAQRYLRRLVLALTNTEKKIIEVKDYEAD